jgi:long-chain acyl-CoA synthetase
MTTSTARRLRQAPPLATPETNEGGVVCLPRLLLDRAETTPDRVAMRRNEECVWREYTWREYAERTALVGLGLLELGVDHGDRVAIHCENRPEWLFSDLGIQGIGAVSVGVYPTSPPAELEYLLGHSEAKVLIAEDEEQLDKALAVRGRVPSLQKIVLIETALAGGHLDDPQVMTFADLEELGRRRRVEEFGERVESVRADDWAMIVYTSGTTGPPKGAVLSQRNLVAGASGISGVLEHASGGHVVGGEILSYLPLCHIFERMNSVVDALWFGVVVNFGKGSDSFASDLRDVQPTAFAGVPRVWEKMLAAVEIRMANASWAKRTTFALAMRSGQRVAARRMAGRMRWHDHVLYAIGWLVLYRSLRDKLGLRRVRLAISGAAPIAPQVLEFFWGIGVPVREGYGQTENTAVATFSGGDIVKIGKVGPPLPGVEIRIADDGEILTRSAANFVGYLKNPDATAETLDADGWLHTGDVGWVDADGFLQITDRKKDLLITAGGKNVSPQEIENKLKVSPYVREAVVFGDRRKYLTALIGIELDTVGDWASRRFIPYTTYEDLASKPEVLALVAEWVEHVNREVARVEEIKAFRLLPDELDHENGQLTATQKVKRRAISEQFHHLIEEMYGPQREGTG